MIEPERRANGVAGPGALHGKTLTGMPHAARSGRGRGRGSLQHITDLINLRARSPYRGRPRHRAESAIRSQAGSEVRSRSATCAGPRPVRVSADLYAKRCPVQASGGAHVWVIGALARDSARLKAGAWCQVVYLPVDRAPSSADPASRHAHAPGDVRNHPRRRWIAGGPNSRCLCLMQGN